MSQDHIKSALTIIERFGGIDGSHHKQWVLDQVARHLLRHMGMSYTKWVADTKAGEDGPDIYDYDPGIAP